MLGHVRDIALKCLPSSAVQFVRDRKVERRDRAAVRAFAAVSTTEPIVFYSIGARGGMDSTEIYFRRRGKLQIVGFEPDADEAARLAASGEFDRVLPYALGTVNGSHTLHITRQPGYSSLREPDWENVRRLTNTAERFEVLRTTTVEVVRLDELVRRENLPLPDMLEIDVQGYEFEVLAGCGELLSGVASLGVELHFHPLYQGEKTFAEVHDWLFARGFNLSLLRRSMYCDGNLLEVDACFYNRALCKQSPRAAATLGYWQSHYGARQGKRI